MVIFINPCARLTQTKMVFQMAGKRFILAPSNSTHIKIMMVMDSQMEKNATPNLSLTWAKPSTIAFPFMTLISQTPEIQTQTKMASQMETNFGAEIKPKQSLKIPCFQMSHLSIAISTQSKPSKNSTSSPKKIFPPTNFALTNPSPDLKPLSFW